MNKKFLSAILFGALMVTSTGTFVSCKDYDDDIDNLQTQIDKLATKEDMTSQIASLQSALSSAASEAAAAKTAAADALAKATASEKAAAQAALDAAAAKEEAIKAAQDEVAKAKAELEEAIAADFEAVKEDLAKQIAELTEKVEEMTGYTTEMLTSLHILNQNGYDAALDLNYARVPATKKFGVDEGFAGAFTLNAGEINTVADDMLINVAPVNSIVTSGMLSLVNGKGGNLNEYLDMSIADYDSQIMTTRAAGNGLRLVTTQLKKDVDFDAFDKLVLGDAWHNNTASCDEHEYIAYALAVTDASKARTITSDYNVTMHVVAEPIADDATASTLSSSAVNWAKKSIVEYKGKDVADNEEDCFPIILGEDFELNVVSATEGRILASYVVVDATADRGLSVTDIAAIKGMSFTGVNEVVKSGIHNISVNGTYAAGVAVPMKLVTIDYYGNTDVVLFAVKANKAAEQTASFILTPASHVTRPAAWTPSAEGGDSELQAFTIPAAAAKYVIELIAAETEHRADNNVFNSSVTTPNGATSLVLANGIMADSKSVLKLYTADKKAATASTKNEKIAYAEFVGTLNLNVMRENKTYTGIVTFYDKTGTFLASNAIEVTKVLPTVVPADFSAKTNAINNGVLTVYPEPNAGKGEFDLNNSFNNWAEGYNKIVVKDVCSNVDANSNLTDKLLGISSSVINDGKTYATTITYNYGEIKYRAEGHGVVNDLNCTVTWNEVFATKFGCYPIDCTYSWNNTPVVYYKEAVTLDGHARKADGTITEKRNVIKVLDPYAKEVNAFSTVSDNPWLIWANRLNTYEIVLWTNGDETKVNEFFTPSWDFDTANDGKVVIKLEPTSTEVVLSGDVEMTVVVKMIDLFGHDHDLDILTFTMKKDHTVAE